MPPVKVLTVLWDKNVPHATRRATTREIEEVLYSRPEVRGNLRGRAGTRVAFGSTKAGRQLTIAFIYDKNANSAYPITAWERK